MPRDKNFPDEPLDMDSTSTPGVEAQAKGTGGAGGKSKETRPASGTESTPASAAPRTDRIRDVSRKPSEVESAGPVIGVAAREIAALPALRVEARMAKVKNLSNQPLYLNLPDARTVKIPPRAATELPHSDLDCPVVLFHLSRGTLIVVRRDES